MKSFYLRIFGLEDNIIMTEATAHFHGITVIEPDQAIMFDPSQRNLDTRKHVSDSQPVAGTARELFYPAYFFHKLIRKHFVSVQPEYPPV